MSENVADLTPKQIRALEALASGETTVDAAAAAGITRRQLARWMGEPAFDQALREAKAIIYRESIARIVGAMSTATTTLVDICGDLTVSPQSRVSAARCILESALKAFGQVELDQRLTELEALVETRNG